jgi:GTPase
MTLIEFPLNNIPNQPPEKYYGNKEYKIYFDLLKYKNLEHILDKRATQMLFRIYEGDGIAKYMIGIKDNGDAIGINYNKLLESIFFLSKIISKINAYLTKIRFYKGINGFIFVAHVCKENLTIELNL